MDSLKNWWEPIFSVFLMSFYLIDVDLFMMMIVAISFNELALWVLDEMVSFAKRYQATLCALDRGSPGS